MTKIGPKTWTNPYGKIRASLLDREKHITKDMCFPVRGTDITRDMSFLSKGTHITRVMCFPGRETYITRDIGLGLKNITSDTCFQDRERHIYHQGYLFPRQGNTYHYRYKALCVSQVGEHMSLGICFPGGETNNTRDMCFPGGRKRITRNICFPGGGTHHKGYVFPRQGKNWVILDQNHRLTPLNFLFLYPRKICFRSRIS